MQTRLTRTEVPVEATWDLSDLFADGAAWEAEYQAVDEAGAALGVSQGQLAAVPTGCWRAWTRWSPAGPA